MANRASFTDTICSIAADGTLKAIANVRISVFDAGTTNLITLYAGRIGSSTKSNPFLTGADGRAEFWANAGDYDIALHDTEALPRIGDDTIGWQSQPPNQSVGFDLGDIKFSSKDYDHGSFIRMDGRTMTQSQVEAALNLDAGDGLNFMNYLGTGGSSKYGAVTAGSIKLPDTRRSLIMGAGPSGDGPGGLTARNLGAAGGSETVTLTKDQSGLPAHGHGVTDPGHSHSASQAPHSHAMTGFTSANGQHTHIQGSDFGVNFVRTGGSIGHHTALDYSAFDSSIGAHSPERNYTTTDGLHAHFVSGTSDSQTPVVSVSSHATGLTVNDNTGANAAEAHSNMSPFVTIGYCFIMAVA